MEYIAFMILMLCCDQIYPLFIIFPGYMMNHRHILLDFLVYVYDDVQDPYEFYVYLYYIEEDLLFPRIYP